MIPERILKRMRFLNKKREKDVLQFFYKRIHKLTYFIIHVPLNTDTISITSTCQKTIIHNFIWFVSNKTGMSVDY